MNGSLRRILPVALACALGISALAQAADKDEAPEKVMAVYDVDVQPSHVMAFEEGIKAWIACRKENGSKHSFQAWESETGGMGYAFTTPSMEWSGMDDEDPGSKACSKTFGEKVMPHIDKMMSSMYVDRDELSVPPPEQAAPPKYVVVSGYNIKPGKYSDFKDVTAKLVSAANKSKWSEHWWTSTLAFGSKNAADVIMVTPAQSWAEIGAPAKPKTKEMLESVYGKDKTSAMYKKFMDAAEYVSSNVYHYNAELSYQPESK